MNDKAILENIIDFAPLATLFYGNLFIRYNRLLCNCRLQL